MLDAKLANALQMKAVKAWKRLMPELKQKRSLISAVRAEYASKLKTKVFEALRSRRDYTVERGLSDAYMTNAIQSLTLRRFFKRWEGLFSRRLGLQLLGDSVQKIQVRSLFSRSR